MPFIHATVPFVSHLLSNYADVALECIALALGLTALKTKIDLDFDFR